MCGPGGTSMGAKGWGQMGVESMTDDAEVVRENRVVRLLREDAMRAVTPPVRASAGRRMGAWRNTTRCCERIAGCSVGRLAGNRTESRPGAAI